VQSFPVIEKYNKEFCTRELLLIRIATAHRSLSCIHQVAPIWAPSTWFLGTRESALQTPHQQGPFLLVQLNPMLLRSRRLWVRPNTTDVAWSLCLCVHVFGWTVRNDWIDWEAVWRVDSRVPRNHVDGAQIGVTWWIQLSDLCAAAMRPCVKLLWSLVNTHGAYRLLMPIQCHLAAWQFCEGGGVMFIPGWFLDFFVLRSIIFSFHLNWVSGSKK